MKQFSRTTALQTENHTDNVRSEREDSSLEDHGNPQFFFKLSLANPILLLNGKIF